MSSLRTKSLINYFIKQKKYKYDSKKFDLVCTQIYILHINRDDDELINESLRNNNPDNSVFDKGYKRNFIDNKFYKNYKGKR